MYRANYKYVIYLALGASTLLNNYGFATSGASPTFEPLSDNQSIITWNTQRGDFRFLNDCQIANDTPSFISVRSYLFVLTANKSITDISERSPEGNQSARPYQLYCSFSVVGRTGSFGIIGYGRIDRDSSLSTTRGAYRHLLSELLNFRTIEVEFRDIDIENYTPGDGIPYVTRQVALLPSREYIHETDRLLQEVSDKNEEVAARQAQEDERLEKENARWQEAVRQDRAARQRDVLVMTLVGCFVGLFFIALLTIAWRSGAVKNILGKVSDFGQAAIRSTKRFFRRKGRLTAAQELTFWSGLRDKGDITQEEFEKRKRELML